MTENVQYEILDNTSPEALNDLLDTVLMVENEYFCKFIFDNEREKRIEQIIQYIKENSSFESLLLIYILKENDFTEAKVAWICNYYNKIQNEQTLLYVIKCFFELCALYWIKCGREIRNPDKKFILDRIQTLVPDDKVSLHDIGLSLKCIQRLKLEGGIQDSTNYILDEFQALVVEFKVYIESIPSETEERILENNVHFLRLKEELRDCIHNNVIFEEVFEEILNEFKDYMTENGIFVALNNLINFISKEDIDNIDLVKIIIECRLEINSTYKWPAAYSHFQFSLESIWKFIKLNWPDECPTSEEVLVRFYEVYESLEAKQLYLNSADEIYTFFLEGPRKIDKTYSSFDEEFEGLEKDD